MTFRQFLTGLFAGCLLLSASGIGLASPDSGYPFRGQFREVEEMSDSDIREYAEFTSRMLETADEIERNHRSQRWYGGLWFDENEDGEPSLFVGVVGGMLEQAQYSLGAEDTSRVRLVTVENSLKVLQDEMERLLRLRDQVIGPERYALGTDLMANRVVLEPAKVELSETELSILNVDPQLVIIDEPGNLMDFVTLRGGQAMVMGASGCTAGFAVKKLTTYATLTAGHCPNSTVYQYSGGWVPVNNAQYAKTSGNADRQIHTFRSGSVPSSTLSNGVKIVGTQVPYIGMMVCHVGVTTGPSCGKVHRTDYAPAGYTSDFILTWMIAGPGDSGAPVYNFNNNKAVGILKGGDTPGDWGWVVHTKIGWALLNTGYSLYLQ